MAPKACKTIAFHRSWTMFLLAFGGVGRVYVDRGYYSGKVEARRIQVAGAPAGYCTVWLQSL